VNRIAAASAKLDARLEAMGGSQLDIRSSQMGFLYIGLPVSAVEGEHFAAYVLRELLAKIAEGAPPEECISGALSMVLITGLLAGTAGE
jgi:hypothetical protein